MTIKETLATPTELTAFVQDRGHTIKPLFDRAANDDTRKVIGYILIAPRGNKTTLYRNRQGLLSMSSARQWCNSVDLINEASKRCTVMVSAHG